MWSLKIVEQMTFDSPHNSRPYMQSNNTLR